MKKYVLSLILTLITANTFAWVESATTTAHVTFRQVLQARVVNKLNFGIISYPSNASSSTITVNPIDSSISQTGSLILSNGGTYFASPTKITLTGPANTNILAILPTTSQMTNETAGRTGTINVTNFTMYPNSPITLGNMGSADIFIGASITINPSDPTLQKGDYYGTYSVTFAYP